MAEEGSSGERGSTALALVFPPAEAIRANRALRARRPGIGEPSPALGDAEVSHWRSLLEGSPTLGTVVDQIYEEAVRRTSVAATAAHQSVATAAIVTSVLVLTIALPAVGQMFEVSPWFLIAVAFAFVGLLSAARAARLARFAAVDLDVIGDPIESGRAARGEAARDVFLVAVRARRAAAAAHNRVVSEAVTNLVTAAWGCLRNAFVALLAWILIDVAPAAFAAGARGLGRTFGA
ncbi:MAG TPA: hypothetical protein VFD92_21135 [Candidatus Binatia bacterium]|nr:hypothetical protein [Candidatus Binatia bacterium]